MKNIAAIILAGGESSRMKQPKAFLKFDNHITFVEKIIYEYQLAGIDKIIIVINYSYLDSEKERILSQFDTKIIRVYNKHPEKGRQYSLYLGISMLHESENCFIQNIDNPFVKANLIRSMIPLIQKEAYISPTFKGKGGHPVLLSNSICNHILNMKDHKLTLRDVLIKFNKITIPANASVLININTEQDYKQYFC